MYVPTQQELVTALLDLSALNRPAFDELMAEAWRMVRNRRLRIARARSKAVRS